MDLWNAFQKEMLHASLGSQELKLNSGERHNYSLSMVDGKNVWVEPTGRVLKAYSDSSRYVTVKNLVFDLLVTFYDVNTSAFAALRVKDYLPQDTYQTLYKFFHKEKRYNIELRFVGMQNGHKELLGVVDYVHALLPCKLVETDLFGANVRHIAIDTKTGMPYNLLLQNRIYRPGELLNSMSKEEFDKLKVV